MARKKKTAEESPAAEIGRLDELIGDIDKITGFHVRLAYGAIYRHFMETFADLELTQKMVSVLWLVHDHPNISQADIGRRLYMDRATTMVLVNRLAERGFLERKPCPLDRRRQQLTLTPEGTAIFQKAKEAIWEHEKWLKSRFTEAEVKTLVDLLRRIHE